MFYYIAGTTHNNYTLTTILINAGLHNKDVISYGQVKSSPTIKSAICGYTHHARLKKKREKLSCTLLFVLFDVLLIITNF